MTNKSRSELCRNSILFYFFRHIFLFALSKTTYQIMNVLQWWWWWEKRDNSYRLWLLCCQNMIIIIVTIVSLFEYSINTHTSWFNFTRLMVITILFFISVSNIFYVTFYTLQFTCMYLVYVKHNVFNTFAFTYS